MRDNVRLASVALWLAATLIATGCGNTGSNSNTGLPTAAATGLAGSGAGVQGPTNVAAPTSQTSTSTPSTTPGVNVDTNPTTPATPMTTPMTTPATTAPTTAGWCDALSVLRSPCQTCHGSALKNGAPMPLVTYADLQAPAVSDKTKKVYQLVGVRIHDTQKPMPPMGFSITTAQVATLDSWIANGAQAGADPSCASLGPAPTDTGTPTTATMDWPADCEMHYKFLASGSNGMKQSVAAGQEAHPSVYFTPTWPANTQGIAFHPVTDNAKVLHHWILYSGDGQFLNGWAPGSDPQPLPADVGIYLPSGPGAQMRLDLHYNNLGGTQTEQDASGVEICTVSTASKLRPHIATTYGFTAAANAPAHTMNYDNTATCTVTASQGPVTIISGSPHMHRLGVHAKLVWQHGGMTTVLHDAPFTFDEQRIYPFDPNVITNSGDQFTTTCTYTNPGDTNVTFGPNTEDEMCFNFVLYYPKGGMSCF